MQRLLSSRRSVSSFSRGTPATLALVGLVVIGASPVSAGPAPVHVQSEPSLMATVKSTIAEASRRFGVPERWIAEVMQVESRGVPSAVSPAGAIGLMQVMPSTYARLRLRYGLGPNPYDLHDNILAGAAYLREMYNRYGAPGFLAAYNAGPGRWEEHLSGARRLPEETQRYLSRLGPVVGGRVGSLPAFTGRTFKPSSFSAPIFVALGPPSAPLQGAAERERIVRVIAANPTVIGRADAIFVARPTSSESTSNDAGAGGRTTDQPRSDKRSSSTPPVTAETANPLFAPWIALGAPR